MKVKYLVLAAAAWLAAFVFVKVELPVAQATVTRQACVDYTALIDADLQASRTFRIDRPNAHGGYDQLVVFVNMDSQNTVTRVDMDCTGSNDGNTTDFEIQKQDDSAAAGTYVLTDTTWRKTVAAADQWYVDIDISAVPDIECVFSVGAGAGTATDTILVDARLCTD